MVVKCLASPGLPAPLFSHQPSPSPSEAEEGRKEERSHTLSLSPAFGTPFQSILTSYHTHNFASHPGPAHPSNTQHYYTATMDLDLKKLKVDQLREELGKRGMDTKGKKDELLERLQNAIDKEMLDAIDEEDEVGVPPPPPAPMSTSLPPPPPAPVQVPPPTSASKPAPGSPKPAAQSPTRMAPAVPAAPVAPSPAPVAPAPAAEEGAAATEAESGETEEEKKRRRAERFGIPISEEEKKKARAERFGLVKPAAAAAAPAAGSGGGGGAGGAGKAGKAASPAKAAAKAGPLEGVPVVDAEEEARRRARAARFGIADPKLEEEKKAERAKRFADPAKVEEDAK